MKNLNSILSKIEKIELAQLNVELAVIDDFTKEANDAIKTGDLLKKDSADLNKNLTTYFKLKSDLEDQKKSLESDLEVMENRISTVNALYNRTSKIYTDIVNKASDIGVDYPKNIDTTFKQIEDLLSYTKNISPKNVKL